MSPRRAPRCHLCGDGLGDTRLVIDRQWTCAGCAYELERGADPAELRASNADRDQTPTPRRLRQPQKETLFPVAAYDRTPE